MIEEFISTRTLLFFNINVQPTAEKILLHRELAAAREAGVIKRLGAEAPHHHVTAEELKSTWEKIVGKFETYINAYKDDGKQYFFFQINIFIFFFQTFFFSLILT
jgi:hypothetical protein